VAEVNAARISSIVVYWFFASGCSSSKAGFLKVKEYISYIRNAIPLYDKNAYIYII